MLIIVINQKLFSGKRVQFNPNSSIRDIATKLRRKLSNNFNFDKTDKGLGTWRPSPFKTEGNNQPAICQSPRIQRERRLTSTK